MKTATTDRQAYSTEQFKETSFGITGNGLSHIFGILRNQIYSDKIAAVIREYCCNAVDANMENGKGSIPIQVQLPTRLNAVFSCRDQGKGLTEQEISEIYCQYGESTKRHSNDYIGQLGIGSKSGFAYGDSFMVISRTKGKKTTYNAYLDPSGIGKIAKLDEERSQEPSGIEVVVPVKQQDVDRFRLVAVKLFEHFRAPPACTLDDEPLDYTTRATRDISLEGNNWAILPRHEATAVMGNVPYRLNPSSIAGLTAIQERLLEEGLCIDFPIGWLTVAASREALEYTNRTQRVIRKRLQCIVNEVNGRIELAIAQATSMWDAKATLYGMLDRSSNNIPSCFFDCGYNELKWNGKPIRKLMATAEEDVAYTKFTRPASLLTEASCPLAPEEELEKHTWNQSFKAKGKATFQYISGAIVATRSMGRVLREKARCQTLLHENPNARVVMLFKFSSDEARDKFQKQNQLEGAQWTDLKDVVPLSCFKAAAVKSKKAESFTCWEVRNRRFVRKSFNCNAETTPQLYCVEGLESKSLIFAGHEYNKYGMHHIRAATNLLGGLYTGNVSLYAVREKDLSKIPASWVKLEEAVRKRVLKDNLDEAACRKFAEDMLCEAENSLFRHFSALAGKLPAGHALVNLAQQSSKTSPYSAEEARLLRILFASYKPQNTDSDWEISICDHPAFKRYPMLSLVDTCRSDEQAQQNIIDYIDLIDKTTPQPTNP